MARKKHVSALNSLQSPTNKNLINVKLRDYFQDKSCDCIICKTENKFKCLNPFYFKPQDNNNSYNLVKTGLIFDFIINLLKVLFPYSVVFLLLFGKFDYSILLFGILLITKQLKTIPLPF